MEKVLNMSQKTISRYENGERESGIAELIQNANYFHVSMDYLVGRHSAIRATPHEDIEN